MMSLVKRLIMRWVQVPGQKSLRYVAVKLHTMMYFVCIANVSGMYHRCTMTTIALYLSCITDVLEVIPYIPIFLHTLPITFLGPSPSGHPVFGISCPWLGLLVGGGSHGIAAQYMLFLQTGYACSSMPCRVLCSRNPAGQASRWGPFSPCSRPNTLGCCGRPNRAPKQWKFPLKSQWRTRLMYLLCISNVPGMYWLCFTHHLLDVFQGDVWCR
jgi:hypothetical protein